MNWKNTPAWKAIDVPAASTPPSGRVARIIADLDVANAPRYKPQGDATFCNIFVTDVVRNHGLSAPTHWMTSGGDPATMGKGIEMSANRLIKWFMEHGGRYGWMEADEDTALAASDRGHLVVVGWYNPDTRRRPGHVAVLLPSGNVAQAGARNSSDIDINVAFGPHQVQYFIQMEHGSHRA